MQSDIDQKLLDKFQQGNRKAFIAIHQRMYPLAFRQAYKMIQLEEEAKDILVDCFFSLWEQRDGFTKMGQVASYLKITVHNKCINFLKHKKRASAHQQKILALYTEHAQSISTETMIIREERLQMVIEEIEKLPKRGREVLKLYLKDLDDDEIALTLGISKKTVANTRNSALKSLQSTFHGRPEAYLLLILILQHDQILS